MREMGPGVRQDLWQNFDIRDGLPSSIVSDVLQDREGCIWFATRGGGVARFDGDRLWVLDAADGLASNALLCLLEDGRGRLWLGTEGDGVSCFDGRRFTNYTTADGLAGDTVNCLLEDRQGRLWFGTEEGGASCWDGREFGTISAADGLGSDAVRSLCEDASGRLWFGTRGGVSCCDDRGIATFSTADGLGSNRVESLLEDRQGRLWLGTWDGALNYREGRRFTAVATGDHRFGQRFTSLLEDREGRLWYATWSGGLSVFEDDRRTTFTMEDGLPNDQVLCLLEDRSGCLWAGFNGGVCRYEKERFAHYRDGLHGPMVLLEDREERIWVGAWNGAHRWDGTRFTAVEGLEDRTVTSIFEDADGGLWFGFRGGVGYSDGEKIERRFARPDEPDQGPETVRLEVQLGNVEAVLKDRTGRIWIGTRGGLLRYDGERLTVFTAADGLGNNHVWALLEDREGRLWIGTAKGLVCRNGGSFKTYSVADGLPHEGVCSLLEDREGRLWVGTGAGVARFDGTRFAAVEGRKDRDYNPVRSMAEDASGRLWFGSWGVVRYDGLVCQSLSTEDGLAHDLVQHILQDRRGDVWIASEGGVTRYRPSSEPPIVEISDVIADRHYGPVDELVVPVTQKLLSVEFRGRSWTTRSEDMAYVYRLRGSDDTWRPVYDQRVEYQDLALGNYTFEVRAVDRDLNYSAPAAVQLRIEADPRIEALHAALSDGGGEFVGESPALVQVQTQLAEVAPTDATVLILGETGTGKGLAARTVHRMSARKTGPFVQVNCGALPQSLVESELFGHERGAFTGAHSRKLGKVELARGGTLFLDEIGDMAPEAQVKLLQLLDEHIFERVGGTQVLHADVRVIAATNRDLEQLSATGAFRQDLFFRLQVFPVQLPPLRQRRADIPLLAAYFTARMAAHLNKEVDRLSPAALEALQGYDWPGNVRELEHAVQRAVIVCKSKVIQAEGIGLEFGGAKDQGPRELVTLAELERRYILEVLERTGGIVKGPRGAAAILGIPGSTLRYRMKKLGISRPGGR